MEITGHYLDRVQAPVFANDNRQPRDQRRLIIAFARAFTVMMMAWAGALSYVAWRLFDWLA